MRLIILSIVFFMMIGSASASMRTDSAKICGVIYKYDSKYVYLKTKSGRKTIAPIEKFSKNQLKSRKEVSVRLSWLELSVLLTKVRLHEVSI